MKNQILEKLLNDPEFPKVLRAAIFEEFYAEAYHKIQNLGGPGFHEENFINRGDALYALKSVLDEMLDTSK